jgi:hypothetical protein
MASDSGLTWFEAGCARHSKGEAAGFEPVLKRLHKPQNFKTSGGFDKSSQWI